MSLPKNSPLTNHIAEANLPEGYVMAESVATDELRPFIAYHTEKTLSDDEIKEDYPDVLIAVCRGHLNLSDKDAPVLTLRKPITKISGEVVKSEITFRTRIKASTKEALYKGVNIAQEQQKYANISKAYLAQMDVRGELDSLSKFDDKVIDQIITLFI